MNTNEFIEKSNIIHNNKYDYSKVEYVNTNTKVCIICPEHGEFWQSPHNHLAKHGCKLCAVNDVNQRNAVSTNSFIKKAKKVHGDKYDYSKVEYVNAHTNVCIICPEHGEFFQTPNSHLSGNGCKKCGHEQTWANRKRVTTEEFIQRAKEVHGDKYDYSKVEYVNSNTKVCIICPEHGEFWQKPHGHLSGRGCSKCIKRESNVSTDSFIQKAKEVHGDKYDYSKVEYVNNATKVCIICKEHGEFWQTPSVHLSGCGCMKCSHNKTNKHNTLTTEEFIERAKQVHGNKYDYSKVEYVNTKTKVCIICLKHGEFWQKPTDHLQGKGCQECGKEEVRQNNFLTTEEFIQRAKEVHGDKYDYSKVEYVNARRKVCIICPEHGEFWQSPTNHLSGNGCKVCFKGKSSKEIKFLTLLTKELPNEEIIYQATPSWLGRQSFDIYLPNNKIAIEYQGEQHFNPIKYFGGLDKFNKQRELDIQKNVLSLKNNCKIFYFTFNKKTVLGDFPYKVYTDFTNLIEEIKHEINIR